VTAADEFCPKPWQWPNILSLDAPLIAVLWQTLLAQSLRVHLNRLEPLVLALVVWFVYLADQVLDALRPATTGWQPARKIFYRRYLRSTAAFSFCLALLTIPLAYLWLLPATFHGGLALAVAVLLYFVAIHAVPARWRGFWPREAVVAVLFTSGIFMPVWLGGGMELQALAIPMGFFSMLCWANCAVIETEEWQLSGQAGDGAPGASTRWAAKRVGFVGLGVALLAAECLPWHFALACIFSGAALFTLAHRRSRMSAEAVNLALASPGLILAAAFLR
jgi:hypothetical protein